MLKDDQFIICAHISNPQKSYLPAELEEEFIFEEYKSELLSTVMDSP
jgi:hypothetical protein